MIASLPSHLRVVSLWGGAAQGAWGHHSGKSLQIFCEQKRGSWSEEMKQPWGRKNLAGLPYSNGIMQFNRNENSSSLSEEIQIQNFLNNWFSKCDPPPSCGNLLEMQLLKIHPKMYYINSGVSFTNQCFNKPSGNSDAHAHFRLLAKL